jgi:hypothetical protein
MVDATGDLDNAIECMKAKMKDAPPKPAHTNGTAVAAAAAAAAVAPGGCSSNSSLRGPAESLRMLADGAAAVRPATEAEEQIKRKEKLVRDKMQMQFGKIMEEQKRLQDVQRELSKIAEPMRRDVELIRERLETVGRDLALADKDCIAKKKAYEEADKLVQKKRKEKEDLANHLRLIIHESEVRKTQKLEVRLRLACIHHPRPRPHLS